MVINGDELGDELRTAWPEGDLTKAQDVLRWLMWLMMMVINGGYTLWYIIEDFAMHIASVASVLR